MNTLPHIVYVRENQGHGVRGSFIDAEWVLHYIQSGQWSFKMEGRDYLVGPGDMVLLPPRLLHVVRPISGDIPSQYVIHFRCGSEWLEGQCPLVATPPASQQANVLRWFTQIHREWRTSKSYRNIIAGGLLTRQLGYYLRWAEQSPCPMPEPILAWKKIEEAIAYLQENFQRPRVSLKDIGQAVQLSPNYLCRLFKANTGYPPVEYLSLLRLAKAEELLLRTTQSCSEIAEAVGYDDLHTFSRSFKRASGLPPTRFRRQHMATQPQATSA